MVSLGLKESLAYQELMAGKVSLECLEQRVNQENPVLLVMQGLKDCQVCQVLQV